MIASITRPSMVILSETLRTPLFRVVDWDTLHISSVQSYSKKKRDFCEIVETNIFNSIQFLSLHFVRLLSRFSTIEWKRLSSSGMSPCFSRNEPPYNICPCSVHTSHIWNLWNVNETTLLNWISFSIFFSNFSIDRLIFVQIIRAPMDISAATMEMISHAIVPKDAMVSTVVKCHER